MSNLVKAQGTSASEDTSTSKPSKKKKFKHGAASSQIAVLSVLAPTRELTIQMHEMLAFLRVPFGLRNVAVYGGVNKDDQCKALKEAGAAMVVDTPGRVVDLMEGACDSRRYVEFILYLLEYN